MSQICIFMPFSNVFLYQHSFKGAVIIIVTCIVSLFCLKYNENVKKSQNNILGQSIHDWFTL